MIEDGVLSPTTQESHDTTSEQHADERVRQLSVRSGHHPLVEQELVGEELQSISKAARRGQLGGGAYLYETSVDQNTSTEGVEDAAHDASGCTVRVVRCPDAQADSDTLKREGEKS